MGLLWDLGWPWTPYLGGTTTPVSPGESFWQFLEELEGEICKESTSKHGVPMKHGALLAWAWS